MFVLRCHISSKSPSFNLVAKHAMIEVSDQRIIQPFNSSILPIKEQRLTFYFSVYAMSLCHFPSIPVFDFILLTFCFAFIQLFSKNTMDHIPTYSEMLYAHHV